MKKNKRVKIYPEFLGLVFAVIIIISSFNLVAAENANYQQYEKLYSSLEMETLEHKKIKLSDLPSPVVIVNFWASWCIPCLEEIPSLIKLSEKLKNELAVVAINTDEDDQLKNIAKIQKKLNIPKSFIIVPDNKFKIADAFKFSAIPVTVIFKKGKVVYFSNGPVDFMKVSF